MLFVAASFGAAAQHADTSGMDQEAKWHAIEVGLMTHGAGVEYHFSPVTPLSADVVLAVGPPGIGVGVSVTPIPWVFGQAVYGTTSYRTIATVGGAAEFSPDYVYGWRGGIQIPLNPGKKTFFAALSGGNIWLVQKEYCQNCVGFGADPNVLELVKKTERKLVVGLGLLFKF